MDEVKLADAKAHLSELVERASQGEAVLTLSQSRGVVLNTLSVGHPAGSRQSPERSIGHRPVEAARGVGPCPTQLSASPATLKRQGA